MESSRAMKPLARCDMEPEHGINEILFHDMY
jgi:hypothetical protein